MTNITPFGAADEPVGSERIIELLARLHSADRSDRDAAVRRLGSLERPSVIRMLTDLLGRCDVEVMCDAAEGLLRIDACQYLPLVLPLLADSSAVVRRETCGLMHDFGDSRAVPALVKLLSSDPEGDIRHIAAYALGGIGDNSALAALRKAAESDEGTDYEGRGVRDAAAEAIDEILNQGSDCEPAP